MITVGNMEINVALKDSCDFFVMRNCLSSARSAGYSIEVNIKTVGSIYPLVNS